ncbi:protocatechuate 3,4-dioxygenase subunit alpha [Demequina sp. NBRC 110056]|uniref:protocatechuate 3,4-dioxygenase subunit alpha n=1 Tax=Demequina sp. NBRC 110056 TaxID=1570345 RepID=UPI0009FD781A|nr:protocatechuate 3,4-dioxygenase subunit alpha [Demequina sp. NBRC 110056]
MSASDVSLAPTPHQTVGPFFAFGLEYPDMHQVAHPHSDGAITLSGRLLDGAGAPVPDGVIEIFSATAGGEIPRERGSLRRDGLRFTGFGRAFTDDDGRYLFWTTEPAPTAAGGAAFFAVGVFARGLSARLATRIYVPGDADALASDPLLASLDQDEAATLTAVRTAEGHLVHDIRLQGERETVFLVF